ncbi:TPA: hypothetical protein QFI08_001757 [Enterococcus faecium]|uniref:hypothetical protein n=1 Tax=Enterococcus TaxID=1350 RepID=UPI0020909260|nr:MULTISPECIES: hypothetical protein [Enterococcus]MCO5426598.1 hypothetical protein [Enterococcus faecium]MCO5520737.1 hypothetical protein [Enterococcus faecium]MDB7104135.1 hypothetical protein [Enterococcus faecium]MDB7251139.1 hypothetical protein [Enterococcus faecium]MDB7260565.1 hypothetical protein [Enterococcus faecium]
MDKEIKATVKLDLTELKELLNKASDQVEQLQETLDEIAIVNKAESENSSFFVKENWSIDLPEGDINNPVAEPIKYNPSKAKLDKVH